jgi:acetyl esterase/lipase
MRHLMSPIFVLIALACAVPVFADGPDPRYLPNTHGVTRIWMDVAYAAASPAQKLDIYLPNEGAGSYPVILAIHGGGFAGGDKNNVEVNPEMNGLTHGYAVVSVNYRLSGEAVFPAAIHDLKAALRFVRAHAAEYHLNPAKIAAWGDSAGGNFAAMLGTSAGVPALEDLTMGNPGQSSDVAAVVDYFGPTDFTTMDKYLTENGLAEPNDSHCAANSPESRYMGFHIAGQRERTKAADPVTYVSAKSPPFFIMNGTKDHIVPWQHNAQLAAALEKAIGKDKVMHVAIEGAGHGGPAFESPENLAKVFAFLDRYLK